jgi:sugar phosphate isomerase/epimerase
MGESYESFYSGGYSSLSPEYGNFVGYRLPAGQIGFPGSAQTANQLGEAVNAIKQGVKVFEVTMVDANAADQIPKQHFREIAALSKLTGVKPSVHAPIIDPAGFGERGWDGEIAQKDAERRLISVIEKARELDPNGNVPVVIHSTAGVPGNEFRPNKDVKPGDKDRFYEQKIAIIDQESKQIQALQEERKFNHFGMKEEDWKKGKQTSARQYLESVNLSQWDQKMTNLAFYQKESDEVFSNLMKDLANKRLLELGGKDDLSKEEVVKLNEELGSDISRLRLFQENNELTFKNIFSSAYKYGDEDLKKELKRLHDDYNDKFIESRKKEYLAGIGKLNPIKVFADKNQLLNEYTSKFMNLTLSNPPEILKPVEEFAMDKSAETFGNVAFESYKKFGKNTPIIAIENMFQGMAFSKAEDMKKLIDKSRDNFAKKLQEEKGMGKSEAAEAAKTFIGATWDVGHLNMMKKHGFTDEDVVKETEKIAKYVKHIHLTDNFGYSDSHLAPGMGNVPFKKILEQLEKAGTLDKARKIVEAPGFFQHFKKSPHPYVLSAFGSPIYGAKMGPSWNQVMDTWGGYFASPMAYMPEKHFSIYGGGFSGLPQELGGQIAGTQSRFSGTPNA